jgi:predicted GIY-YIG superfamily endonuclease
MEKKLGERRMGTKFLQDRDGKKSKVFVYCLTFASGKCYVGVTGKTSRRLREHRVMAENGREYALNNAWRKYGDPVLTIWERRKASWSPERRAILGAKDKSRYWKVKMLKALALQEKSETNQ